MIQGIGYDTVNDAGRLWGLVDAVALPWAPPIIAHPLPACYTNVSF